jgi:hypothetical protein
MHTAHDVSSAVPVHRPRMVRERRRHRAPKIGILLVYIFMLGGVAARLYCLPIYSMDSIQNRGNALLIKKSDPAGFRNIQPDTFLVPPRLSSRNQSAALTPPWYDPS